MASVALVSGAALWGPLLEFARHRVLMLPIWLAIVLGAGPVGMLQLAAELAKIRYSETSTRALE